MALPQASFDRQDSTSYIYLFEGHGEQPRKHPRLGGGRARRVGERQHRRRPDRGVGPTGWEVTKRSILSPLQGSPRASECDAQVLAGWPRHRHRTASRGGRRHAGWKARIDPRALFRTRQHAGHCDRAPPAPMGAKRRSDCRRCCRAGGCGASETVSSLFRALGLSASEAEARAVLFYTFLFGQSLLFFDDDPRRRANLVALAPGC